GESPWAGIRIGRAGGGLEGHGARAQAHPATPRHGIPRVNGQIDDDLLDHAAIGVYRGKTCLAFGFKTDVFTDELSEHAADALDDVRQIDVAELKHLLAAEHE